MKDIAYLVVLILICLVQITILEPIAINALEIEIPSHCSNLE